MAKVEIFNGEWSRTQVALDQGRVYLFGDNLEDAATGYVPTMTQAVIRGLPNAVGLPTKKKRGYTDDCYFWDTAEDFELFKAVIDRNIHKAVSSGKTIVIPSGGIGTGRAATRGVFATKGNRFKDYLDKALASLSGITPGKIRVCNIKTYKITPGETPFYIDRRSPVGNPFHMQFEEQRHEVCVKYCEYFYETLNKGDNNEFIEYAWNILNTVKAGHNVALLCWCAPKECHGDTIKQWVELGVAVNTGMTIEKQIDAIMTQVYETKEWISESRGDVIVEALRYGWYSPPRTDVALYVYHPGQPNFKLSEASARRYIKARLK